MCVISVTRFGTGMVGVMASRRSSKKASNCHTTHAERHAPRYTGCDAGIASGDIANKSTKDKEED